MKPDNTKNYIDSRDVIARIKELEEGREGLEVSLSEVLNQVEAVTGKDAEDFGSMDGLIEHLRRVGERELADRLDFIRYEMSDGLEELQTLEALEAEAHNASNWEAGATLIRDSHFWDFALQEAEECSELPGDHEYRWPYTHIDWKAAVWELKDSYRQVNFGGVIYWVYEL